jgi:hypothetical protein
MTGGFRRPLEDGDLSLVIGVMLEQPTYHGSYRVARAVMVFDPAYEIVRR